MLIDYDSNETGDPGLHKAECEVERAVYLMVQAHAGFVNMRYGTKKFLGYPKLRGAAYFSGLFDSAEKILAAGKDPAVYVSFIFENWKFFHRTHKLKKTKSGDLTKRPGIAWPSLAFISSNKASKLLDAFLNNKTFAPKDFRPASFAKTRGVTLLAQKVARECLADGITEDEWWTDLYRLSQLPASWLREYAAGLHERAERFEEMHGVTVEEFIETIDSWSQAPLATAEDSSDDVYPVVPWGVLHGGSSVEVLQPTAQEEARNNVILAAISDGVDVEADRFQRKLDQTFGVPKKAQSLSQPHEIETLADWLFVHAS